MDVIVVLLFALSLLVVHMLTPEPGKEPAPPAQVLGIFAFQLIVSLLLGEHKTLHGVTCRYNAN